MPAQRHIAFVAPRFSEKATIGGAETLLKELALRVARAGHKVTFLTTCADNHYTWENSREPGQLEFGGMTVHFFRVNEDRDVATFLHVQDDIDHRRPLTLEQERSWITNSVNSRDLEQHLQDHGSEYDAVLAGPYLFGITFAVARLLPEKTFLVPCLHDEVFAYLGIMKELFSSVKGLLFNAQPERELAESLYAIDRQRKAVVGMGMEPFESDGRRIRTKLGFEEPYVLYSGRREPGKGTPTLLGYLHAFRARTASPVRLVFTGSGDIHPHPELAPYVKDLGFASEQDKHDAMAGAAAFIHPSVNESFGIVLLESFLAGTPGLVHAGSKVLKWQCQQSNGGLWFRAYPDFEEALQLLLSRPDLARAMGAAGKRYVQTAYGWESVLHRLFQALEIPA